MSLHLSITSILEDLAGQHVGGDRRLRGLHPEMDDQADEPEHTVPDSAPRATTPTRRVSGSRSAGAEDGATHSFEASRSSSITGANLADQRRIGGSRRS